MSSKEALVLYARIVFLSNMKIFFGESTEENPARKNGSSKKNIKGLAASRSLGIDPTCPLPAVSSCVLTDTSGKTYRLRSQRMALLVRRQISSTVTLKVLWFDVVRFVETEERSIQTYNREILVAT
jgi:hypothetical protein